MKLLLFRHLWGVEEPWESFFPKARAAGYHGIETHVPEGADRKRLKKVLKENGLRYIADIYTGGKDAAEHAASFEKLVDSAAGLDPLLVNSHSGRDSFSRSEAAHFFDRALAAERKAGVGVAHETHRGRILYNPWTTAALVDEYRDLKLNFDLSHWACVCERMLDTEEAILAKCAPRCLHIHARVGHEEGPQVSDPRAPEFAWHLEKHEGWWDLAWEARLAAGEKWSTLTPEFGPPGYMPTLPYTQAPVADLNAICDWHAQRQAARFKRKFGQE
jgi:sugar phosphate isomerase/epimerase